MKVVIIDPIFVGFLQDLAQCKHLVNSRFYWTKVVKLEVKVVTIDPIFVSFIQDLVDYCQNMASDVNNLDRLGWITSCISY